MRRHIKFKATIVILNASLKVFKVKVHFIEQTHVGKEFGIFIHNGFELASNYGPENSVHPNRVWIRGTVKNRDDRIIELSPDKYARFKATVKAYNEKYSDTKG